MVWGCLSLTLIRDLGCLRYVAWGQDVKVLGSRGCPELSSSSTSPLAQLGVSRALLTVNKEPLTVRTGLSCLPGPGLGRAAGALVLAPALVTGILAITPLPDLSVPQSPDVDRHLRSGTPSPQRDGLYQAVGI